MQLSIAIKQIEGLIQCGEREERLEVKSSDKIGEAHITRETGGDLSMSHNKKLLTYLILLEEAALPPRPEGTRYPRRRWMNQQNPINQSGEAVKDPAGSNRHPITQEHSPQETIERMRSLPERAAKLKETLRALRETHSR